MFFFEVDRILRQQGHETLLIASGTVEDHTGAPNLLLLKAPDYNSQSALVRARSYPAAVYDLGKKKKVKEALAAFKPDVFHAFSVNVHLSPAVVVAAAELEIPIVGTFNDYKHICPNYKLFHHQRICYDCKDEKFYHAALNNCCKSNVALSVAGMIEAYIHKWLKIYDRIDHFTFSSDFMAEITRKFWPRREVSWSKLRNPFNSQKIAAQDRFDDYGLYFGRLTDEKGVDRLIRAAAKIGGFPIKIVGDGSALPHLQTLARQLNLNNIEFLGPKWGSDLDSLLGRARFVVVPSVWHENYPYVINQSFAHGRPVLGANRGGIPEMVKHGDRGLIFDPDDIDSLAGCISRLAQDIDEARRMGLSAKKWSDATFRDDVAYSELMFAYRTAAYENHCQRR